MSGWPYPEDDKIDRRSRVARMYRGRLADVDAPSCAELDEAMNAFGQSWVFDRPDIPPESLLTVAEIAGWADVSKKTVSSWVRRGHLKRRLNADREIVYLLQDLIDYQKRRSS